MCSGIPNRDTHEPERADAHVTVSSSIGVAPGHRFDAGRGPTILTWMCTNLCCGCGKSPRAVLVCLCTFQCWHASQRGAHSHMFFAIQCHTNLDFSSWMVERIDGWDNPCMELKPASEGSKRHSLHAWTQRSGKLC